MSYTYIDRDVPGRIRMQFICDGPSLTKQSFVAECDINTIMSRFEKTGTLTHINEGDITFADVSSGLDYQEALHAVMHADDLFMKMPAKVRTFFANDAAKFMDFVNDPANDAQMYEMGLKVKPPVPAAVSPVPVADKPPV